MGLFDHEEKPVLQVDEHARYYLLQTARWTKFLAITAIVLFSIMLMFIVVTVLFLSGAEGSAAGYQTQGQMNPMLSIAFALIALVLYVYPIYTLLKFSGLVKAGIEAEDQEQFNDALKNLFRMFRFLGVMVIITIIFYVLAFLFGVAIGVGSSV